MTKSQAPMTKQEPMTENGSRILEFDQLSIAVIPACEPESSEK
jgi:hypothetical protein